MTLKARITWENAGTALLPEALADVRLEADGAALPFASRSTGVREVVIPAGTGRVTLKAQFEVAFGAVGAEPPMRRVVWRAEQAYDVVGGGTALEPVTLPQYGGEAHPLVEAHVASGVNGAALIRLRTEFVDVTPFWMAYAEDAGEYLTERHPNANLVALGYTGGAPKIWFASFTNASLAPPKLDVSCLVFFRPATRYTYTRVDQKHDMGGLNRYLLQPVAGSADYWKRDVFNRPKRAGAPPMFVWIRCGFEDALDRCGKAVVMLHPWPSGLGYGDAEGGKLAGLAEAAIRFLWAGQRIAKDKGPVRLGRLGISGYSSGGSALWSALRANAARVDEVYSFDAKGASGAASRVIRWFTQEPTRRCLRMSSGHQIAAHGAIKRGIENLVGTSIRVTADPPRAKGYAAGANPLWDYVLTDVPALRSNPDAWHQLAMFGGYVTVPGPSGVTFLLRFLQDSDF